MIQKHKWEPRLSVSMIVKNEEGCLAQCLESVKDADEIVIVDTGSEDKTIEIARKYTARIYDDYKWNDDFAEARNHALAKATGDWILTIDADEVLEEGGIGRIRNAIAETENDGVGLRCEYAGSGEIWWTPRVYRRHPDIQWKGAVHNFITCKQNYIKSDIKITVFRSKTHAKDPDRALRILKKEVTKNPRGTRNIYYLAKEYMQRRQWVEMLYWLDEYLLLGGWPAERTDALLLKARALWNLRQGDRARKACLDAIGMNPDFKEAIEFMAYISNEHAKDRWLLFAETASNSGVLFERPHAEKGREYYNHIWGKSSDCKRYANIYAKAAELANGKVLDVGCGTAELSLHVKSYSGFDFSEKAIEAAKSRAVWVGDVYDQRNYSGDYDTYVMLELLEHIDDMRALPNVPKGKRIILSVPSFPDMAHLRFFTEQSMRRRYEGIIAFDSAIRFNWSSMNGTAAFSEDGKAANDYITLATGTVR